MLVLYEAALRAADKNTPRLVKRPQLKQKDTEWVFAAEPLGELPIFRYAFLFLVRATLLLITLAQLCYSFQAHSSETNPLIPAFDINENPLALLCILRLFP